jgi:hypothetical protein
MALGAVLLLIGFVMMFVLTKVKDLSAFGRMKTNWDGLMRECRECRTKLHRDYYNNPENHEKHKEYIRNYIRNYKKKPEGDNE